MFLKGTKDCIQSQSLRERHGLNAGCTWASPCGDPGGHGPAFAPPRSHLLIPREGAGPLLGLAYRSSAGGLGLIECSRSAGVQ